jgi:hypothetical protein
MINDWNEDANRIGDGVKVSPEFVYASNTNPEWMTKAQLHKWVEDNKGLIGTPF